MNHLAPENCNKSKCKTCIFNTNGNEVKLSLERRAEIERYLALGESSHICHTTEKTCYGAMEFQANIFHKMGIIPNPTVKSFLETARKALGIT